MWSGSSKVEVVPGWCKVVDERFGNSVCSAAPPRRFGMLCQQLSQVLRTSCCEVVYSSVDLKHGNVGLHHVELARLT